VERALDSDIQQLCNHDRVIRDKVKKNTVLNHTPRLQTFLSGIPNDAVTIPEQGIEIAIQVLSSLNASLNSSYSIVGLLARIPGVRSRRVHIRRSVSRYHREALEFMAPKSMRQEIQSGITKEEDKLTKEMRKDRRARRPFQNPIRRKLKALTGDSSAGFIDIAAAEEGTRYISPDEFEARKVAYMQLLKQQRNDMNYARETRDETITPAFEILDFLPVTSFR